MTQGGRDQSVQGIRAEASSPPLAIYSGGAVRRLVNGANTRVLLGGWTSVGIQHHHTT